MKKSFITLAGAIFLAIIVSISQGFESQAACGQYPCRVSDCSAEAFVCLPLSKLHQAAGKGAPPPADRLKIPICQAYAAEADEMQKKNVAYHCGLDGPRWQNNFPAHFSWCLISTPQVAAAETSARQVAIRDCIEAANAGGYRPPKATHLIDPTVLKGPASLPDAGRGPRPLAAVADRDGVTSRFISNEVIVKGAASDVTAFLSKHPGEVISVVGPTPPPPGQAAPSVPPKLSQVAYVVRLQPGNVSLEDLDSNAEKIGLAGLTKFSSLEGANLAALVLREMSNGAKLALNFVSEPNNVLSGTKEQPDLAGVSDAFQWNEFKSSNTMKAWQFIVNHGIARRVRVAIIDGGFWLNNFGVPCAIAIDANCGPGAVAAGSSDLPPAPIQFNPIGSGGQFAGGPNPNNCNSPCPWHGNAVASVATGTLNNGAGAAGTGGQVADPILLESDGSDDTVAAAVIDAIGFGADIINMSFGSDCNALCRIGRSFVVDDLLDQALDGGILVVASAGNNGEDALDNHTWPCQYSSSNGTGVYCVGALSTPDANGYSNGDLLTPATYSNWGDTVNIWAPTNIHVMQPPASGGTANIVSGFPGTSASAPFVAGVAAMMKAVNPSLSGNDIKNIIGNYPSTPGTALIPSPYSVTGTFGFVIQPYDAVVAAAGGYHLKPEIDIALPADGATIVPSQYPTAFLANVVDIDIGKWPLPSSVSKTPCEPTRVFWKSDVDGALDTSPDDTTGAQFDFKDAPEGLRRITATVTNAACETSSSTISIAVKYPHIPPIPVITWPTDGITVQPGTYTVTGHAKSTDPGDLFNLGCDRLSWDSGLASTPVPNALGECQRQVALTPGVNQVSLTATGKYGDRATTSVSVNVKGTSAGLVVQILAPQNGSNEVSTNFGSNIGLSATASPIQPNSVTSYEWSWFKTGSSPTTKKFAGVGENTIWNIAGTGICTPENVGSTQDVTLELDVVNSVLSNPALTTSGTAQSSFHISCQKLT
jgi:subtilase family protein